MFKEAVMVSLLKIEGVGKTYAEKLKAAGIRGTQSFLKLGATRQGRKQIAESSGVDEGLVLEWVNHVDLMRVKGVGEEYSDLLEEAGVDTVVELGQRNPDNLHKGLEATNQKKKLVRKMPTRDQVAGWIEQAQKLPRVVQY
jgi:predicted flap endonuclease-1-like 5' DNA nuclease